MLYCTWRPSGLAAGLRGQPFVTLTLWTKMTGFLTAIVFSPLVLVLEIRRKESNTSSVRSLVVDEDMIRQGHWLDSVLCGYSNSVSWVTGRTSSL